MDFKSLNLSKPILKAITDKGYITPSPIQAEAIPAVLTGRDVMAMAQTGTGKTAGFTLPLLDILSKGDKVKPNNVRALILTPTRELAAQVEESVATYGKYMGLKSTVVFGGVKINPQMMRLRGGVDVLVATPGRLLDLYSQNAVRFTQVEVLILDEADRMLDMGFIHDIKKILKVLPKNRQNLLFSATFSKDIKNLAQAFVKNPIEIAISPETTTAESVDQHIISVDKKQKARLVTKLIKDENWEQVLIFTKTKHGANKLTKHIDSKGIRAAAIHGSKSQSARTKALAAFKKGDIKILVATDIAARGLDIDQLPQVVNYDLPFVAEDYVHRIGRTGRAGSTGNAVSLVSADEYKQLLDIERLIQQILDRKVIRGFEPVNPLKRSLELRAVKAKRPKKHKGKVEHHDGQKGARKTDEKKPNSNKSYWQKWAKK